MQKFRPITVILFILCCFLLFAFQRVAHADGTETLGPPSIPIATGSGIIAAGTGLLDGAGVIDLTLPNDAVVKQVLLYWEGQMRENVAGDNTARLNGDTIVPGTLIGGPTFFFRNYYSSAFRADITELNLIGPGYNEVTVDDVFFTQVTNGAGILVIYEDASGPVQIDLRDGVDLAFFDAPEPIQSTVMQLFTFPASPVERIATFTFFVSSVAGTASGGGLERPESLEIRVGDQLTVFSNELNSWDGEEWDTKTNSVVVPAGATTLTAQIFSRDDLNTGNIPSSLAWVAAALALRPSAPAIEIEKLTNGADADDANGADVPVIEPGAAVTWTYRVSNIGTLPFSRTEILVTDDLIGPVTQLVEQLGNQDDILAPGEVWIYQATGTALTLATNPANTTIVQGCSANGTAPSRPTYENIGTVVATPTTGGDPVTATDPSHYCNPFGPAIDIEKATNGEDADTPTGPLILAGSPVNWSYVVTNIGNTTLTNVAVTDDQIGPVVCPRNTLAPTEQMTCTAAGVALLGQYANIGSVIGTPATGGEPVRDSDPSHYFGYAPAAVGDKVFTDINPAGTTPQEIAAGSGLQDGGDQGIDGVIVELYTSDNTLISTTVTAGGGLYLFDNLVPGDYYLVFINPFGSGVWSEPNVGDDPAIDSDPIEPITDPRGDAQRTAILTLASGVTDLTWDAGVVGLSGAASATVGDRVWFDVNRNGIQDPGEPGRPGVTVRLYRSDGSLLRTTTTNDRGIYGFSALDPGDYFIEFVAPPDFTITRPNAGDDNERDSDADPATGRTPIFTLEEFVTDLSWDMGIFQFETNLDEEQEPNQPTLFLPLIRQ